MPDNLLTRLDVQANSAQHIFPCVAHMIRVEAE